MSTAEITAHNIYETYNLGALPQEVKRQLMILILSDSSFAMLDNSDEAKSLAKTKDELCSRASEALLQIQSGQGKPIDELLCEIESNYPWLCK